MVAHLIRSAGSENSKDVKKSDDNIHQHLCPGASTQGDSSEVTTCRAVLALMPGYRLSTPNILTECTSTLHERSLGSPVPSPGACLNLPGFVQSPGISPSSSPPASIFEEGLTSEANVTAKLQLSVHNNSTYTLSHLPQDRTATRGLRVATHTTEDFSIATASSSRKLIAPPAIHLKSHDGKATSATARAPPTSNSCPSPIPMHSSIHGSSSSASLAASQLIQDQDKEGAAYDVESPAVSLAEEDTRLRDLIAARCIDANRRLEEDRERCLRLSMAAGRKLDLASLAARKQVLIRARAGLVGRRVFVLTHGHIRDTGESECLHDNLSAVCLYAPSCCSICKFAYHPSGHMVQPLYPFRTYFSARQPLHASGRDYE